VEERRSEEKRKETEAVTDNRIQGGSFSGGVVQAHSVTGGVHLHGPGRPAVIPRQLPAPPVGFVGRTDELDRLSAALESGATVVVSAIGGTGGVGKTALTLHWAHRRLDLFPDGQLHVDLRGFDPVEAPMPPGVAVRVFLDALGIDPGAIPLDTEAQIALYRTLIAGKRMLIVLDNARDSRQVEPLLPGTGTCTVLVTSRDRLAGLVARGAQLVGLRALCDDEARLLLGHRLGEARLAREPRAVAELLDYCAGLPLALGIAAAHVAFRPGFPLAVFAEELRESATRLDALSGGDLSTDLRAVMSCSLRSLDREAETAFLLLALAPGPDIGLPAAASLLAVPLARARRLMGVLENAHLVQRSVPDRYRMHDLVRLFGAERGEEEIAEEVREEAWGRLFDFYLRTAHDGSLLIHPHKLPEIEIGSVRYGTRRIDVVDMAAALVWFDTEHACLLAVHRFVVRRGRHLDVYRLTWSLDTFYERRHHVRDLLSSWRAALGAARCLGDSGYEIEAQRRLANAYSRMGDREEGLVWVQRALDLAESSGDLLNLALTHISFSCFCGEYGDFPGFLDHSLKALRLFGRLGYPGKVAHALGHVGEAYAMMGHYGPAEEYCLKALALARRHQNVAVEADILHSLGYIAYHTGSYRVARHRFEQSLARFRSIGNRYDEANALEDLGGTYVALAESSAARTTLRQALTLYRMQGRDTQADRVAQALSRLPPEESDV